jgi:hypothetical protein
LVRCFRGIAPNEKKLVVHDELSATTLLLGKSRPAITDDERARALESALHPATRFFRAAKHDDFATVSAAIDWYQDSVFSDNQTFSYLAACIGLESLLGGDEHMDGMSKRLADRYAFLLGKGRSERNALASDYTKVLKLRGTLVHAKTARLTDDDRETLSLAQEMLMKAIWHELHHMYRSIG